MARYYRERQGVAPELPVKALEANLGEPDHTAEVANLGEARVICAQCDGEGCSPDGVPCELCEKGAELRRHKAEREVQRQAQEELKAQRQAQEVENVAFARQTDAWKAIWNVQSPQIRREMDFGPMGLAFGAGTVAEREQILQDIWERKYERLVLPASDSSTAA